MNLDLASVITPDFGGFSVLNVRAGGALVGGQSVGQFGDIGDPLISSINTGMLSGFVDDGAVHSVSTGLLTNIPVNTPVPFFFSIVTGQAYSPTDAVIAVQSFNLATSGNVFTLLGPNASNVPSVNSTDAGIVNNQFVIPEPSTLVMAILAAAGIGLRGCRRRKRA